MSNNNTAKRGPNANKRPPPISTSPPGKFWNQEDQKWRNFVQLSLPPRAPKRRMLNNVGNTKKPKYTGILMPPKKNYNSRKTRKNYRKPV